jgi:hypothetical protein
MLPLGHSHSILFLPFFGFFALAGSLLILVPYWFIFKKAGFHPLLSLLMVIPLVNLIALYFLAFAQWNVVPVAAVYPPPASVYPPRA